MDAIGNINELPVVNLAQIFEKLPWKDRLKIEQVCKNWQNVAKNLSWSNYKVFDNLEYEDWPEARAMQIKPFFERCGRHLRHLTLRTWSPQTALTFIRMAPNVQHLRFWRVKLDDESLKELAGIVPELKSFAVEFALRREEKVTGYNLGLMECFKVMTGLEYLSISKGDALFGSHSFVQFPSNLKYLDLHYVSNVAQILSWVAEGCKNLKGLHLRCSTDENLFHAISRLKSLTYLAMSLKSIPYEMGYVFEELTELRALEIDTLDEVMISAIARHCNKLEHIYTIDIYNGSDDIGAEKHAAILRLTSLPNLCSLEILAYNSSDQIFIRTFGIVKKITETVNRLIFKGNLQYIKMQAQAPLEPDVLLEILRRCKSIRTVALNFGPISSDFYSRICQAVDEIDEDERQQRELTGSTHPIVVMQYNKKLDPYKWLRFNAYIPPSAICEKWKFGWLGAGKPEWES